MSDLDEWDLPDAQPPRPAPPPPADARGSDTTEAPAELYYPTLDRFVRDQLAPMYRRHLDGVNITWCKEWWRHAEAVSRLDALWRAWEHLRQDPATGISVWFRDHADHHMRVLFDPAGPFRGCSPEKGHATRLEPLPLVAPPPQLFTDPVVSSSADLASGGAAQYGGPQAQ